MLYEVITVGGGRIHHVQQQRGVVDLLQRGAERRHQVLRQVADEAHRVGQDVLGLVREAQPSRRRVQRREELVLREDLGPGQRVQQRRLAGVSYNFV